MIEKNEEKDRKIIDKTFSHLIDEEGNNHKTSRVMKLAIPGLDTVKEITNILSKEECQAVIEGTSTCKEGFSRPSAFSPKDRDCHRIHTVDKTMSEIMMPRLRPYLPEIVKIDGVRWQLSRFTHHWRYVRYYPGGHFSPHYDGVKMSSEPVPCLSVFTLQIYLNGIEDFTGGATRFYPDFEPDRKPSQEIPYGHVSKLFDDKLSMISFDKEKCRRHDVLPEEGKALLFNHALNTLHDGGPVLTGTKYIMRGDILYTALPEDIHLLPTITSSVEDSELSSRHWCPFAAAKHGTRNHIGEVWYCVCAEDQHGADVEKKERCWTEGFGEETKHEKPRRAVQENVKQPKALVLISGKRASGKDYIANKINVALQQANLNVHRAALGNINKELYAESVGIDVNRLLTDRAFKERHRIAMIQHHANKNEEDPEWCVKEVMSKAETSDILLLSDLRTLENLAWFQKQGIPTALIRINASDEARRKRGWEACDVKDNLKTEVDLDEFTGWTAFWDNSDGTDAGHQVLNEWIEHTVVPRVLSATVDSL
ncbi:uncharacterized protein [Clytia hemisphaerica]|uniref:Phosphomevalonate kinase n=1 Tax=Clytia hemisphaerica TaxID=252671 RepID=A0A7M5UPM8_9CNID